MRSPKNGYSTVTVGLKAKQIQGLKTGEGFTYPVPKRLFTLKEASVYLSIGLYTVRELIWRGELPVVRNGRKQLVDIRDLDHWIDNNKVTCE